MQCRYNEDLFFSVLQRFSNFGNNIMPFYNNLSTLHTLSRGESCRLYIIFAV